MTEPGLVAVTPYNARAGSSRVRVLDWLAYTGIAAAVHSYADVPNFHPTTLVRHPFEVARAEVRARRLAHAPLARLLLSREASPLSIGGLESALLRRAELGVYDFDDALQWDVGTGFRRLANKPRKCYAAVQAADVVIAGNDTLADWAGDFARHVVVIPSCIDPSRYAMKRDWSTNDPPRLVWLGSPATEHYLAAIAEPLVSLHQQLGLRLTVISGAARHFGPLDTMVDRVAWSEAEVPQLLTAADIGIGPLIDTPYARGKSSYKLLQYAAAGLPVVASPVGTNASVVAELGGVTARDADEWRSAIADLVGASDARRARLGETARTAVERRFSFAAWEKVWLDTIGMHGSGQPVSLPHPRSARAQ